jgi:hypothetical protein
MNDSHRKKNKTAHIFFFVIKRKLPVTPKNSPHIDFLNLDLINVSKFKQQLSILFFSFSSSLECY